MINLNKLFLVLFFLMLGCKNSVDTNSKYSHEKEMIHPNLKTIIDKYIAENPLQTFRSIGKSSMESGFSYPSYHLFFYRKDLDTIFSIVLFSNYNNFELEGTTNVDNETSYKIIEHKGWIMYKKKFPLIIFDDNNYSSSLIKSDKLSFKIPDSLKTGYNNQHIKFIKWNYKINNNNFQKMNFSNDPN